MNTQRRLRAEHEPDVFEIPEAPITLITQVSNESQDLLSMKCTGFSSKKTEKFFEEVEKRYREAAKHIESDEERYKRYKKEKLKQQEYLRSYIDIDRYTLNTFKYLLKQTVETASTNLFSKFLFMSEYEHLRIYINAQVDKLVNVLTERYTKGKERITNADFEAFKLHINEPRWLSVFGANCGIYVLKSLLHYIDTQVSNMPKTLWLSSNYNRARQLYSEDVPLFRVYTPPFKASSKILGPFDYITPHIIYPKTICSDVRFVNASINDILNEFVIAVLDLTANLTHIVKEQELREAYKALDQELKSYKNVLKHSHDSIKTYSHYIDVAKTRIHNNQMKIKNIPEIMASVTYWFNKYCDVMFTKRLTMQYIHTLYPDDQNRGYKAFLAKFQVRLYNTCKEFLLSSDNPFVNTNPKYELVDLGTKYHVTCINIRSAKSLTYNQRLEKYRYSIGPLSIVIETLSMFTVFFMIMHYYAFSQDSHKTDMFNSFKSITGSKAEFLEKYFYLGSCEALFTFGWDASITKMENFVQHMGKSVNLFILMDNLCKLHQHIDEYLKNGTPFTIYTLLADFGAAANSCQILEDFSRGDMRKFIAWMMLEECYAHNDRTMYITDPIERSAAELYIAYRSTLSNVNCDDEYLKDKIEKDKGIVDRHFGRLREFYNDSVTRYNKVKTAYKHLNDLVSKCFVANTVIDVTILETAKKVLDNESPEKVICTKYLDIISKP